MIISQVLLLLALAVVAIVLGFLIYFLNAMTVLHADQIVQEASNVVLRERAIARSLSLESAGGGGFDAKWQG